MMMHPPVSRASRPILHQELQCRLEPVNSGLLYKNEIYEEVFQDASSSLGRRSSSSVGSEGSFYDAASDVGSTGSSTSASDRTEGRISQGASAAKEAALKHRLSEWEKQLSSEHEARMKAEGEAELLGKQVAELQSQVNGLKLKIDASLKGGTPSSAGERESSGEAASESAAWSREADVLVARMVAQIFADVISRDESERRWAEELKRLQARVERSALMESIAGKRQMDRQLQEAVQTKWLGPGVAVGCFGVGVIAAYCAIRYWKRPL